MRKGEKVINAIIGSRKKEGLNEMKEEGLTCMRRKMI
jgi:hypothetical protein